MLTVLHWNISVYCNVNQTSDKNPLCMTAKQLLGMTIGCIATILSTIMISVYRVWYHASGTVVKNHWIAMSMSIVDQNLLCTTAKQLFEMAFDSTDIILSTLMVAVFRVWYHAYRNMGVIMKTIHPQL